LGPLNNKFFKTALKSGFYQIKFFDLTKLNKNYRLHYCYLSNKILEKIPKRERNSSMNQKFKNWAISQFDQTNSDIEKRKRQDFLRTLKFDPNKVTQWIADNICQWAAYYNLHHKIQTGEKVGVDFHRDPQELLKALQEHFAKEIATITK
jgi:hypothetical protein